MNVTKHNTVIIPFILKYLVPVKLFSYGECELNQKWPDYLSWMKILKILLVCAVFLATTAQAENFPDLNDDGELSIMGALSDLGLHNLQDERWNAYAQGTYMSSFKQAFPAAYTNLNGTPNSLSPNAERGFTATFTAYFGLKAWWTGGQFYMAPEMISERPLSGLRGIGGAIQNFELQKKWYRALYLVYSENIL
jgi:high affinity Mn2+ porin